MRYETQKVPTARALLTVAADGRSSPFREQAGLKMVDLSAHRRALVQALAAMATPRIQRVRWRRALWSS